MKDIPLSKQITSHSFPKERERERDRNDDEDDDVARSTGWRAWGLDDKILLVRQEVAIVVVFIFFPRGEFW